MTEQDLVTVLLIFKEIAELFIQLVIELIKL